MFFENIDIDIIVVVQVVIRKMGTNTIFSSITGCIFLPHD